MMVTSYRDLIVWQKAMDLVVAVYELTDKFPREEIFGLTFQLRKAAVSVPSNIAEGHARRSTREFLHHLSISRGSIAEVETQTLVAIRIKHVTQDEAGTVFGLATEVTKMIHSLMTSLENRSASA
jgi:four helix bundle protein